MYNPGGVYSGAGLYGPGGFGGAYNPLGQFGGYYGQGLNPYGFYGQYGSGFGYGGLYGGANLPYGVGAQGLPFGRFNKK